MQFTGCDKVSSFSSHGKRTALKLLIENKKSQDAFARVGQQWTVPEIFLTFYKNSLAVYTNCGL